MKAPSRADEVTTLSNAARLIKTAPDMYEVLKEFVERYESDYFGLTAKDGRVLADWYGRVNAAIRKAEGE